MASTSRSQTALSHVVARQGHRPRDFRARHDFAAEISREVTQVAAAQSPGRSLVECSVLLSGGLRGWKIQWGRPSLFAHRPSTPPLNPAAAGGPQAPRKFPSGLRGLIDAELTSREAAQQIEPFT